MRAAGSGWAAGAAKTDTALSAKVAKVAMDLNNILEDERALRDERSEGLSATAVQDGEL